ncbi:hypothetical protein RsS62_24030 [Rhizobium dioscoreae]|nr:hypothetical protein RsS62_24030 [Rhizobium dioscoreae]
MRYERFPGGTCSAGRCTRRTILFEALTPYEFAIAVAALRQMQEEARQPERHWVAQRGRECDDAERAQWKYDAVEPEKRLLAIRWNADGKRSCVQSGQSSGTMNGGGPDEPLAPSEADHDGLPALGKNLCGTWHAHRLRRSSERVSFALLSGGSRSETVATILGST